MQDIAATLAQLSLTQMVLAWTVVGCYALALGGMLDARGSRRAAVVAALAAVAFCVLCDPWVHGALLVTFAVAGMGLFVATAWVLARTTAWALRERTPAPSAAPAVATPRKAHQPLGVMLRDLWRSMA